MNPNWQVRYFYDVGEDGTLRKVPRERELSVPESMRRPRPKDPALAALNDGNMSEGFLSRRTSFVGKEEQGQRKKHDGFRAQDDYDSEDRGAWVTPAPDSKTSKRSTDPHLGPVKKPERLDLWTESTDDASLRFK
jgi:hypothetical protein